MQLAKQLELHPEKKEEKKRKPESIHSRQNDRDSVK